jgi:DNA modification methylase
VTTQRIIAGDCIAGLRTLPDASVHCCVTSPPYWGLRDYGTATWEGGDAECDHQTGKAARNDGGVGGRNGPTSEACDGGSLQYRDTCGKCGARRIDQQLGLESTPEAYVARMVEVFREVRRVLRDDGTLWLNLGDSYAATSKTTGRNDNGQRVAAPATWECRYEYARTEIKTQTGLKPKDLVGIPWRVAFALQADGWWLRQDIIWHKPNPMPESVRDRCTKAHEYVFLLTKSERYFYDAAAVSEAAEGKSGSYFGSKKQEGTKRQDIGRDCQTEWATRNRRSVWTITTKPYSGAHFAVMPADLVEPCIRAGTSEEGCCQTCGAPWERVVERGDVPMTARRQRLSMTQRAGHPAYAETLRPSSLGAGSGGDVPARSITTTGWQPSCDCDAHQPVPCTVLDPFAGSGTTLAVAAELGRNAIGCELNPEYIALADQRIKEARESVALFESTPHTS